MNTIDDDYLADDVWDEGDVWDDDDDDAEFAGTDAFEDQAGMTALKAGVGVPDDWILVKVVGFTARSLTEQIAWLRDNARGPYRRVGWSSGCSTKVGIAFEDASDAILYKLRWRG